MVYPHDLDVNYLVEDYQNPLLRIINEIKNSLNLENPEKAFCHFTIQASKYYPDFENKITIDRII